jgi:hypothetical protein
MRDLATAIPDVQVLLALEPEELGAKLLFLVKAHYGAGMFHPGQMQTELWTGSRSNPIDNAYPRQHERAIGLALTEAWAWLEAQGLVVPEDDLNGRNGWRRLSRRAQKFENAAEFANYAVARMLPKEALHLRISGPVWISFMRGEFDTAAFQAMKAVEVAVREAGGLSASDIGTKLMRKAFDVEIGPVRETGHHGCRAAGRRHGCGSPGRSRSDGRRRRHDGFWSAAARSG